MPMWPTATTLKGDHLMMIEFFNQRNEEIKGGGGEFIFSLGVKCYEETVVLAA